jgi:sirohydrochlorin ferrochelatase
MQAIILLGHGSKVADAGRDMERVAAGLRERHRHAVVEICYMAHALPDVSEALTKCAARGAKEIIIIPYFLHVGQHMRADVPELLREKLRALPDVKVVLGKNLGFDDVLVDLVEKRIHESAALPDVRAVPVCQG